MAMADWHPTRLDEVMHHLHVDLFQAPDQLFREGDGFARSVAFMELLGQPQDRRPVVHVAGTAGKGSVASGVAHTLSSAGVRTGLHLSPHVYDLRERWQVDGQLCSEDEVVSLFQAVLPSAVNLERSEHGPPTFYEFTLGMALLHFAAQGCEVVVIETGLGGLYDGTNAVTRADKVAVITKIGLDHEAVLGSTLEEIAAQKAGILRGGQGVALRPDDAGVEAVLQHAADCAEIPLLLVDPLADDGSALPFHVRENLAVARASFDAIGRLVGVDAGLLTSMSVLPSMPGRFEIVETSVGTMVLDGAHNPIKMAALVDQFRRWHADEPVRVVFGCRRDKRLEAMLTILLPVAASIGLVEFDIPAGDLPADRSVGTAELADAVARVDTDIPVSQLDGDENLERFLTAGEGPVLIVGSFALLAAVRPLVDQLASRPG